MQSGQRAAPLSTKLARGTFRPSRDANRIEIIVAGDPPEMPDFLTGEAQAVWRETIGRVMQVGVAEPDSAFLARYCAMEARSRQTLGKGEPIPASLMTALRQMEELLGIAGPKSRIGRVPDGKPSNPFARNGRR